MTILLSPRGPGMTSGSSLANTHPNTSAGVLQMNPPWLQQLLSQPMAPTPSSRSNNFEHQEAQKRLLFQQTAPLQLVPQQVQQDSHLQHHMRPQQGLQHLLYTQVNGLNHLQPSAGIVSPTVDGSMGFLHQQESMRSSLQNSMVGMQLFQQPSQVYSSENSVGFQFMAPTPVPLGNNGFVMVPSMLPQPFQIPVQNSFQRSSGMTLGKRPLEATSSESSSGSGALPKKKKKAEFTSKYKGVTWHKRDRKWIARVWVSDLGRVQYLGTFFTEEEAAKAIEDKQKEMSKEKQDDATIPASPSKTPVDDTVETQATDPESST